MEWDGDCKLGKTRGNLSSPVSYPFVYKYQVCLYFSKSTVFGVTGLNLFPFHIPYMLNIPFDSLN